MIPVERGVELGLPGDSVRCSLCWVHTRYWSAHHEVPYVPLCESCAQKATPVQIPGLLAYCTLRDAKDEAAHRRLMMERRP